MFFASWISIKEGKNGNCDLICEISDSIPKEVRDQQHRSVGQEFVFIPKGKGALLMPVPGIERSPGPAEGIQRITATETTALMPMPSSMRRQNFTMPIF
jgi:hypothetical protein